MSEKKKKQCRGGWLGYCPFSFCAGSRYNKLYHDTSAQGPVAVGHDTTSSPATQHHDMANMAYDTASPCTRASGSSRVRGLTSEVCHDTMFHIVIEENGNALRYSAVVRHYTAEGAPTRAAARATLSSAGAT